MGAERLICRDVMISVMGADLGLIGFAQKIGITQTGTARALQLWAGETHGAHAAYKRRSYAPKPGS
jgi:hypothetical protein